MTNTAPYLAFLVSLRSQVKRENFEGSWEGVNQREVRDPAKVEINVMGYMRGWCIKWLCQTLEVACRGPGNELREAERCK